MYTIPVALPASNDNPPTPRLGQTVEVDGKAWVLIGNVVHIPGAYLAVPQAKVQDATKIRDEWETLAQAVFHTGVENVQAPTEPYRFVSPVRMIYDVREAAVHRRAESLRNLRARLTLLSATAGESRDALLAVPCECIAGQWLRGERREWPEAFLRPEHPLPATEPLICKAHKEGIDALADWQNALFMIQPLGRPS